MRQVLDVGCGHNAKGDVNVDLSLEPSLRRETTNFVLADAHYLPFRDSSFDILYGGLLLEHCTHPINVLKEFKRVSRQVVYVEIPYCANQLVRARSPNHIFCWTPESFENLLSSLFPYVEVYTTESIVRKTRRKSRMWFLHDLVRLFIRRIRLILLGKDKITAICYKRARLCHTIGKRKAADNV